MEFGTLRKASSWVATVYSTRHYARLVSLGVVDRREKDCRLSVLTSNISCIRGAQASLVFRMTCMRSFGGILFWHNRWACHQSPSARGKKRRSQFYQRERPSLINPPSFLRGITNPIACVRQHCHLSKLLRGGVVVLETVVWDCLEKDGNTNL